LVLLQVGLNLEATNWIMGCVRSTNLSVLVNGNHSSFFNGSIGLRQGCHLSSLLFFLIVEGPSNILKKLVEEGRLEGVLVANGVRITNMLFVDDVILFGKGSFQEWRVFKNALNFFCNATGMDLSNQKSQFLELDLSDDWLDQLK